MGAPVAVGDHHHAAVRPQLQRELLAGGAVRRRLRRCRALRRARLVPQQRRRLAGIGEQKVDALRVGRATVEHGLVEGAKCEPKGARDKGLRCIRWG